MAKPTIDPETREPLRRGALVMDKDGDVWRRGNTRWTCQTPVGTNGVTNIGRLPWYALEAKYGPLTILNLND